MNRLVSLKAVAAMALVLGTFGAASTAHARSDVQFSITLQSPGLYVQPAPVYVQPAPVYTYPRPVYLQPAPIYNPPSRIVYVQPAPVYVQPPYRHGWGHHHHGQKAHARGPWGDYDRDGTPNRVDRFPADPYRR